MLFEDNLTPGEPLEVPAADADAPATAAVAKDSGGSVPVRPARRGNVCGEPTKTGGVCRTPRMSGRDRCRFHESQHDPQLAALVASDRQRGGAARVLREFGLDLGDIDLASPNDIRRVLAETTRAVAAGRIPSSVGSTVSQLMSTALRVAETELHHRLAAIEDALRKERQA